MVNNTGNPSFDVLIVGGGPAGTTAGIYAARSGLSTAILDKGLTTGALGAAGKIANYPGIEGEISGAELLETMRSQAKGFGVQYIDDKAIGSDLSGNPKVVFGNKNSYEGKVVMIATGSMGRSNLIKGEAELLGKGVSYCAICDAAFFKGAEIAVVGRNDEAVEDALYLTRFAKTVHFVSPAQEINAQQSLLKQLQSANNVTFHLGAVVREILGKEHVESIRFTNRESGIEEIIPVTGAFVFLQGGVPITDFLQGQLEINTGGCLSVDRENQTSIPGVYAMGDVLCLHTKQAVIAASDGAIAAISAEKYLRDRRQPKFDW